MFHHPLSSASSFNSDHECSDWLTCLWKAVWDLSGSGLFVTCLESDAVAICRAVEDVGAQFITGPAFTPTLDQMAVKTNYEIRSHSFPGRSSSAIPPAGGRTSSMSAIPAVGQNASYTSLRDLMPSAALFSCYNRREPGLLDLKQLRMRDRLVEHAVRAYLHPRGQPRTRPRTSRSFCSFLKIITVPLQTTHNLLQAFFHEAGVWFRRMYVSI